jgi:paraquat-inducible protein B
MSKQANPSLIGAFVLGAIVLLVIFVLIIGGDSFNRQSTRFVTYFDESINGLTVGSNVMFRGVPIGVVSAVEAQVDADTFEFKVPVYIDIYSGTIKPIPGTGSQYAEQPTNEEANFTRLLDLGLRTSLKPESLITGQLYVELDFFPDQEAIMRGDGGPYREIPSVRTGIQEIVADAQNFMSEIRESVDIQQLGQDLQESMAGINRLINDPETARLSGEINATLASIRKASDSANALLASSGDDAGNVAASLGETLDQLQELLVSVNAKLSEESDTTYRVNATLREIENAARSLRVLADYLQEHPEALVTGKQK